MTYPEKLDYIFDSLEETQTPLALFSRLTGISRWTLYKWKRGEPVQDKLRIEVAYQTAKRLHL